MSNPVTIYKWIFITVCVFLIVEAISNITYEMQSPAGNSGTKIAVQAKTWIRSLFMIAAAVIIFILTNTGTTNAAVVSSGLSAFSGGENIR
jgi:hypothetical protein